MSQTKSDNQQSVSSKDLPNDEWELQEFIERFLAELDKVQDTISLKSSARGLTFGPTNITLQINVFPRYDSKKKSLIFRTAKPGEVEATVLKLEMPSLLRDQIQTHGIQFQPGLDTRPLTDLPGITSTHIIGLNRLGVFTVGDLKMMTISPEIRAMVVTKVDISIELLSKWFNLPFIRSVKKEVTKKQVSIAGDRFGVSQQETKQVLFDNVPQEVVKWEDKKIQVKLPEGKLPRSVIVANDEGLSNRYLMP